MKSLGCNVTWLEQVDPNISVLKFRENVSILKSRLETYGLNEPIAFYTKSGQPFKPSEFEEFTDLAAAEQADLLINLSYGLPPNIVSRFKRKALVDIDPGLTQIWISNGWMQIAPHDVYFSIGETVGKPGATFPDLGLEWQYTPPCVALDWWPVSDTNASAPFTTVSNWYGGGWIEEGGKAYENSKRFTFYQFIDLPRYSNHPLELALCLNEDHEDIVMLKEKGWHVVEARRVTSSPRDYQNYIQRSFGEFSCVKPSCIRLQNAWISDRTICYLASGKPAVIQNTGPSRFLPNSQGLFRFCDIQEAAQSIQKVAEDYERQCILARKLAEEFFDSKKIVSRVLEYAL